MTDHWDLLVSNDYNSLYPSTITHKGSKGLKIETTIALIRDDSEWICSSFNIKTWGSLSKSEFFKIEIFNPKEILFQHMPVKEIVFTNRKNRHEEINSSGNGDISHYDYVTGADIEKVVRSGGHIVDVLVVFIWQNFEYNPIERIITDLTDKTIKFKKNKSWLQTLTKKCSNSVYGGCISKDIEKPYKYWTPRWMRNYYDDSVKEWFPLHIVNLVVKIKDRKIDVDNGKL